MKKASNIFFVLILLFVAIGFNTVNSYAQEGSEKLFIGPGIAYGNGIEKSGIGVDSYFKLTKRIRAGISFTYFDPEKQNLFDLEWTTNYYSLELNSNYFFYSKDAISTYGIIGLNIFVAHYSVEGGVETTGAAYAGLNLGIGAEYNLGIGRIFTELNFNSLGTGQDDFGVDDIGSGDPNQLFIGAGFRFGL